MQGLNSSSTGISISQENCENSVESGVHGCTTPQDTQSGTSPRRSCHRGVQFSPVWLKIDQGLATLPVLEEGRTVQEIANELGVDRIYIARVERSALNKMQIALRQFALDYGLKAEISRSNVNTKLPRMRGNGTYHRGDLI